MTATKQDRNYWIYRWKWENFGRLKILESVPIHLDMELNSDCNLSCIMCPFHSHGQVGKSSMPIKMAKKIIDEFAEKGGCSIKFVYRGEPLLYKDLSFIIAYAKNKGIIDTIVNTNGMLLDGKKAKSLILNGLDTLVFSVDSHISTIYRQIRRGGELLDILRNITSIQALKQFLGSETPIVKIQGIVQDLNKSEMNDGRFREFWEDIVDEVLINPNCMEHERLDVIEPTPDFRCENVYKRITIRSNGDIALCCGIDSDDKILGNIEDESIEDIWGGDNMKNIRTLIETGNSHLIPACRICDIRRKYAKIKYFYNKIGDKS